ncbi:hypothetical protein PVAND_012696 [Polypedilum vanderplanki]|uniref:Uncharacterized protein n=1 Tax=Polypedilum vanderplanki TaxID=319348 RepID=A0A9J6CN71_POLVA|nr:hypothetical protein PVAND_012696 [Polypedilum vanderplanki]
MTRVKKQTASARAKEEKAKKFKELSEDITNYVTKHRFHEVITAMMNEAYTRKTDNPWEFMVNYIITEQNLDIAKYYNAEVPVLQNENTNLKNQNINLMQENLCLKNELESLKNQLMSQTLTNSNDESVNYPVVYQSPIQEQQCDEILNNFPTVVDASNEDEEMCLNYPVVYQSSIQEHQSPIQEQQCDEILNNFPTNVEASNEDEEMTIDCNEEITDDAGYNFEPDFEPDYE